MTSKTKDSAISSLTSVSAPIGLFDSGVGGLSVYMHLKQALPNERYVYYADTKNVPYGPRSSDEIKQLSLAAVDWLVAAGCKLIVIACNSASAHALQVVRKKYPQIPIVGLVPALKPAVLNSVSKSVAVLATKATLEGELLNTVIYDYAVPAEVDVIKSFNPDLVPWVEGGMPLDSMTASQLKTQLYQFADQRVDHLVLGCTHYPFFRDFLQQEVSRQNLGITVMDSGSAIANRVKALLQQQSIVLINDSVLNVTTATEQANPDVEQSHENSCKNQQNPNRIMVSEKLLLPTLNKISRDLICALPHIEPSGLYVSYTDTFSQMGNKVENEVLNPSAQLSFFVSDPKADLREVSSLIKRLIYHQS